MLVSEKLAKLFPTPESLLSAKQNYSNWTVFAKAMGISKNSLYDHRRALGMNMGKGNASKQERKYADYLTMPEIDKNIQQMFGGESKNVVKTYRITNMAEFEKNVCGDEGLSLVGTEQGSTWGAIGHQTPNPVRGRGRGQ
jgi:hypothetical protein